MRRRQTPLAWSKHRKPGSLSYLKGSWRVPFELILFVRESRRTPPGALGLRFVASLCRVARHLALSWEQRNLLEPGRLRPTEHQIHVLDGLPGRTFHQIVER